MLAKTFFQKHGSRSGAKMGVPGGLLFYYIYCKEGGIPQASFLLCTITRFMASRNFYFTIQQAGRRGAVSVMSAKLETLRAIFTHYEGSDPYQMLFNPFDKGFSCRFFIANRFLKT